MRGALIILLAALRDQCDLADPVLESHDNTHRLGNPYRGFRTAKKHVQSENSCSTLREPVSNMCNPEKDTSVLSSPGRPLPLD